MGKFDGVLLCSDFDETYYHTSAGTLPSANRSAVEYFTSQGGRFAISTGRARRTIAPLIHLAPVNAPSVLANGAQLYDFQRQEMLAETFLPPTIVEDLEALARRQPEISVEVYQGDNVFIWNPNPWTWYHVERARVDPVECPVREMPQPWHKAILQNDRDILLLAQADILAHWPDRYEAIFSSPHMLEVTAKGCTKGSAVLELARRLGVSRENLYCAGDNQNDLSMLAVSAIPFAPANCAQEVRDSQPCLLPPCGEGAIAALIEILDQRYG